MRSGSLKHRVLLEERKFITDPIGGQIPNWIKRGCVSASIEPIRGREALMANELIASMDTRIIVRWNDTTKLITSTWRIKHQDTIYSIASPPVHKSLGRREIELMCKSGLSEG